MAVAAPRSVSIGLQLWASGRHALTAPFHAYNAAAKAHPARVGIMTSFLKTAGADIFAQTVRSLAERSVLGRVVPPRPWKAFQEPLQPDDTLHKKPVFRTWSAFTDKKRLREKTRREGHAPTPIEMQFRLASQPWSGKG